MKTSKTRIVNLTGWGLGLAVGCGGSVLDGDPTGGRAGTHSLAGAAGTAGSSADQPAHGGRGGVGGDAGSGRNGGAGRGAAGNGSSGRKGGAGRGAGGSAGSVPMMGGTGEDAGEAGFAGAGNGGNDGGAGGSGGDGGGGAGGENTHCNCASSAAVTLLDCGDDWHFGGPMLSTDGSTIVFSLFTSLQGDASLGRWTTGSGTTHAAGQYPVSLSADGRATLTLTKVGYTYFHRDGASPVRVPFTGWGYLSMSRDGITAVGVVETSIGVYGIERWTEAGGLAPTGFAYGDFAIGALNDDASVMGGSVTDYGAALLTPSGTTYLGPLPGGGSAQSGGVGAISADGGVAAGLVAVATGEFYLFRYTEATGMVSLGRDHGVQFHAPFQPDPVLVSADGSVLAGTLGDPNQEVGHPFRFTDADGIVLLDPDAYGSVLAMSADGSIILGDGRDDDNMRTTDFVWDAVHGRRELEQVLRDAGADLTGWTIGDQNSPLPLLTISDDGKVVVGTGTCDGSPALYRAVLPE
jgi:hypothetical protein